MQGPSELVLFPLSYCPSLPCLVGRNEIEESVTSPGAQVSDSLPFPSTRKGPPVDLGVLCGTQRQLTGQIITRGAWLISAGTQFGKSHPLLWISRKVCHLGDMPASAKPRHGSGCLWKCSLQIRLSRCIREKKV